MINNKTLYLITKIISLIILWCILFISLFLAGGSGGEVVGLIIKTTAGIFFASFLTAIVSVFFMSKY
jgi:hypothetical protein